MRMFWNEIVVTVVNIQKAPEMYLFKGDMNFRVYELYLNEIVKNGNSNKSE